MNNFKKFTSIEKFSDAWFKMQKYNTGKLLFRSKIKLHGTNGGVRITDGEVTAQKRSEDVTPLKDNAGFALWVSHQEWNLSENVIIYGEWAGPGIQKSDAISKTDRKRFYVFGILLLDEDPCGMNYIVEPGVIRLHLPSNENIVILPWFDEPMTVDGNDVNTAKAVQQILEDQVKKIGDEDPFVKERYGVSGTGEGLVIGPYDASGTVNQSIFNSFVFKVKSEAHAVSKTKSAASVYVEVPESVKSFADTFVTDARCQQMIDEHCEGSMAPKVIGVFLKNINQDILKESKQELAGLDIEWKMVAKEINKKALAWFQQKNMI